MLLTDGALLKVKIDDEWNEHVCLLYYVGNSGWRLLNLWQHQWIPRLEVYEDIHMNEMTLEKLVSESEAVTEVEYLGKLPALKWEELIDD